MTMGAKNSSAAPGRLLSIAPMPVAHFGQILSAPDDVFRVLDALVPHQLLEVGRPMSEVGTRFGDAVGDIHHEAETIDVVSHHHVERRRGAALLLVAAH